MVFEVGNSGGLDQISSTEGKQRWMNGWWVDHGGRMKLDSSF